MYESIICTLALLAFAYLLYIQNSDTTNLSGFIKFWKSAAIGLYKISIWLTKAMGVLIGCALVIALFVAFPILLVIPALIFWNFLSPEARRDARDLAVTAAAVSFLLKK